MSGTVRRCRLLVVLGLFIATGAMAPGRARTDAQTPPPPASITFLHFNDVYEIDAVGDGHEGGLSRVATIRDRLLRTGTPVLTVLGGDFLSPSVIGLARVDGELLAGRQMVDVLNAVGVDWATFGNHEFDVTEQAFHSRLAQATFKLVSTNVTDAAGRPFDGTVTSAIVPVRLAGRTIRIGLIGLTLDENRKAWVKYQPPIEAARPEVARLHAQGVDAVVALTHLALAGDQALVTAIPGIDLVLGGHEHENIIERRGASFTPIVKADSNVRSVAVVTMTFGSDGTRPAVEPRIEMVDDRVPRKESVQALVDQWMTRGLDAVRRDGFTPDAVVGSTAEPLDGRGSMVRYQSTNLTDLITLAMMHEAPGSEIVILNGGSIRVDDVLPAGPVRQYDVLRVLPFGGKVVKASLDGALLVSVLDAGVQNAGSGGYLHARGVTRGDRGWLVGGAPIDPARRYVVAMPEFLLTGGEARLDFLTRANPQVHDVQEFSDIRFALINELKKGTLRPLP
jgi:5'-nucleotidase / UDP-sugar diphosphatase